ncbi:MAG: amidohydrolase family protein [Acidobacteria bacterium]|nr:amidohydrolase family protein [Acidobacteriota bacterium]
MAKKLILIAFVTIAIDVCGWAQQSAVSAKLGYPQMILYNGKIVTMDDSSFDSKVGSIVQAMAVRDARILATGTDAEVRLLAGPQTKVIDLEGRTVLPSFIITHEHPMDWAFQEPRAMTHVFPDDDNEVVIHRWMPNLPPKEQLALFDPMMQAALAKAKPGQWVWLSFNYGPNYEHATEMAQLFDKSITKEYLDVLAPDTPVKVRNGFITSIVNQKALDALLDVHPDLQDQQLLSRGGGFSRPMEPNAMFRGKQPLLAQVLKAELEWWASYGMSAFASGPYAFGTMAAYRLLDANGEMPVRYGWAYPGPAMDLETMRYMASLLGTGTDYIWLMGVFQGANGGNCSTAPIRDEWKENPLEILRRRECFDGFSGPQWGENLENAIRGGMRVAGIHVSGDVSIDNLMDAIEKISKEEGMTLEQIRAKRHAFDHSSGVPRPQQIPRMKELGMLASLNNNLLWEPPGVVPNMAGTAMFARIHGVEYTSWISPRKSLTEAGVMSTFEIDRPLADKIFFFLHKGMTRYNERDGMVYGPGERTDRIIQLKAITRWGAYYLLKEDVLGTLEPGKFADFVVLDKDYLTVPENEIPNLQVLMTVVGGRTIHLTSGLANAIGMQPVGYTTWKDKLPAGW